MAARGWPAEDTSVAAALAALEAVAASPSNTPRDEVYGVLRQCAESFRGAHDRATLKAVGTRDAALAALARSPHPQRVGRERYVPLLRSR